MAQAFDSAISAFEAGNYSEAYRLASSPGPRGCALIMLGAFEEGLALIGNPESAHELFCSGIALWGLDGTDEARRLWQRIDGQDALAEPARRLLGWLDRGRVRMLIQGREDPAEPTYNIVGNLQELPFVDLRSVGFASNCDIRVEPYVSMGTVLAALPAGWEPDLYFSYCVEDHPPPLGIESAPFVTLCHTQDYDRHFSQCYHSLALFDGALALGAVDHGDMVRFTKGQAFVFPLLLTADSHGKEGSPARGDKTLDIYVSGKNFDNNDGKSRRLFDICGLGDRYEVLRQDGYVSPALYRALLRRARLTFTYVNRWGLINGRAIEALSEGCCALYQEGGELGIFLNQDHGAVPYGPNDDIAAVAESMLRDWDARYAKAAEAGMRRVAEVFDYRRCAKRLAVMLAVFSALTKRRPFAGDPRYRDLRYVTRSWRRIGFAYDHSWERFRAVHSQFAAALARRDGFPAGDALGEAYLYAHLFEKDETPVERSTGSAGLGVAAGNQSLKRAIEVYQTLVDAHPHSLTGWFNLGRLLYEAGDHDRSSRAFAVVLDDRRLLFDPNATLFWREFHDRYFDYDLYMREIVEYRRTNQSSAREHIIMAIRDSSLAYCLEILLARNDLAEARRLLDRDLRADTTSLALALSAFTVFARCGDEDAALRAIGIFLDTKPWMAHEFATIAAALGVKGDHRERLHAYDAVLKRATAMGIVESRFGFNIIEYGQRYYLQLQSSRGDDLRWMEGHDWPEELIAKSVEEARQIVDRLRRPGRRLGDVRARARLRYSDGIHLVYEGIRGYNVIWCDGRYYAIRQGDGEFSLARIDAGAYRSYFVADDLEMIVRRVRRNPRGLFEAVRNRLARALTFLH